MAVLQWKNKRAYAVHFLPNKKRKWVPLGVYDRKVDGHEAFVKHLKFNDPRENKVISFKELEPRFWEWYEADHSAVSIKSAKDHWKHIKKHFGDLWVPQITVAEIEAFKANPKWGTNTLRLRLILIKQFLQYAQRHGFKTTDPFAHIKIKQKKVHEYEFKAPPKEKLDQVINYLKTKNYKAYATAMILTYSGVRPIELERLGKSDILEDKIRVRAKNKIRWVPAHPKIRSFLPEIPLNYDQAAFKTALKKACLSLFGDMSALSPYSMRHFFGTELLRKTKNLRLVSQVMGHSNLQMTARYAWVLDDEQQAGVELLD